MMNDDTIAALATRAGEAAVNIIKISGKDSISIVDSIFKSKTNKKICDLKTYKLIYGNIFDDNEVIDEVLISVMKAPKSYTKEDIVEINCHGGLVAVNKILELVINKGARLSEPGEFTKKAFLKGRIDLSQAEAVIDIINAKTINSLKIAANNLSGSLKNEIKDIRKKLLDIIIEIEAAIDFVEEDLEIIPYKKIEKAIKEINIKLIELIKNEEKGEIIKNGIKITIAGKPNVGKSSLLNLIVKKEKSIVTHIPGTTRDAIDEIIYMNGIPVIITDTAGIRKSKNYIESIGVKRSISEIEKADIIIIVLDNSRELSDEDIEIIKKTNEKKIIICINKVDKRSKLNKEELKKYIRKENIIEISATKKIGIGRLEERIKDVTIGKEKFEIEEKVIINKRQKISIEKAKNEIENALKAIELRLSEEFPAIELRSAYNILGEIIGENTGEDILNGIFRKFCIGK